VDVGIAAAPGPARLAVSLSNAFAGTVRPGSGPRERSVSIAQDPEGGTTVTEALGPEIGFGDLGTPPFAAANAAWEGAYFPAVLRAGAAWDTGVGTVAVAASEVLRQGGLEPEGSTERFTASFRGTPRLPLRASYDGVKARGATQWASTPARARAAGRWAWRGARAEGTSMGLPPRSADGPRLHAGALTRAAPTLRAVPWLRALPAGSVTRRRPVDPIHMLTSCRTTPRRKREAERSRPTPPGR
jgi:hypothetical protein